MRMRERKKEKNWGLNNEAPIFSKLYGTKKQIILAEMIRNDFYKYYVSNGISVDDIIKSEICAEFWIRNRKKLKDINFIVDYFKMK